MTIGNRIKEVRIEKGLTQKELASAVGMAQASLSELETGSSSSSTLLASIATKLGVRALWLETGKGPKTDDQLPSYQLRSDHTDRVAQSGEATEPHAINEDSRVRYQTTPKVSLMYVTDREIALLTAFRECTDSGQKLIEKTSASAERDVDLIKKLRSIHII